MKLLIIGESRHGKDTVAQIIKDDFGLKFMSSSLFCAEKIMMKYMQKHFYIDYESAKECFEDRHNHREAWYTAIKQYNSKDKSRLAKEILSNNECYVGMRDDEEYQASKHLFDIVLYIDASSRIADEDDTMKIEYNEDEMCLIENEGTLQELREDVHSAWYEL